MKEGGEGEEEEVKKEGVDGGKGVGGALESCQLKKKKLYFKHFSYICYSILIYSGKIFTNFFKFIFYYYL